MSNLTNIEEVMDCNVTARIAVSKNIKTYEALIAKRYKVKTYRETIGRNPPVDNSGVLFAIQSAKNESDIILKELRASILILKKELKCN